MIMLEMLEKLLNNYLNLDPEAVIALKNHDKKIVQLNIYPIKLTVFLEINNGEIKLFSQHFEPANAIIHGSPLGLLQVLLYKNSNTLPNTVTISGDILFIQDLKTIFQRMDIDWEEQLSRLTGDSIAHKMGNGLRRLKKYHHQVHHSLMRSSQEYIQEEIRLSPTRAELNDFLNDVDTIRNDTERMAARVAYLLSMDG
jgi:ubiquinone biosynthesis protein UbiJ